MKIQQKIYFIAFVCASISYTLLAMEPEEYRDVQNSAGTQNGAGIEVKNECKLASLSEIKAIFEDCLQDRRMEKRSSYLVLLPRELLDQLLKLFDDQEFIRLLPDYKAECNWALKLFNNIVVAGAGSIWRLNDKDKLNLLKRLMPALKNSTEYEQELADFIANTLNPILKLKIFDSVVNDNNAILELSGSITSNWIASSVDKIAVLDTPATVKLLELLFNDKSANNLKQALTSTISILCRIQKGYNKQLDALWLKNFIKAGVSINYTMENREQTYSASFLNLAIINNGSIEMIQTLIELGADVNFKSHDGDTALSLAKKYHREDVIQLLMKNGARDEQSVISQASSHCIVQ